MESFACSGDIYGALPNTAPEGSPIFGNFAAPKSPNTAEPSCKMKILSGFTSRWTMPKPWRAARPASVPLSIFTVCACVSRRLFFINFASVPRAAYFVATYASAASDMPKDNISANPGDFIFFMISAESNNFSASLELRGADFKIAKSPFESAASQTSQSPESFTGFRSSREPIISPRKRRGIRLFVLWEL